MPGMRDLSYASRLRDLVKRIAEKEISRLRPTYSYGEIVAADEDANLAFVQFASGPPAPVHWTPVRPMGGGITVRVAGVDGDRYIDQAIFPIYRGFGDPNGSIVAEIGSLYLRRDGGAATTLYVKESDSGDSIGWVAK